MTRVMARASRASRWATKRAVLRLTPPKFDSKEFARSTGQRSPRGRLFLPAALPGALFPAQTRSSMPTLAKWVRTTLLS